VIVVTGGAGFIGSCVVSELNRRGIKDIIVVDRWDADGQMKHNLEGKSYKAFYDKCDFLQLILSDAIKDPVSAIFHMGACSSTTGTDPEYYRRNNFEYSCHMARWSMRKGARLIYASSAATYGDGHEGYSDSLESIRTCKPLNYYGQSKQKFDEWVIENQLYDKIVGLKFFNVFGPNEYHKGDMKSVIAKAYDKVVSEGKMVLFKSHRKEYADGEQMRDFVYVKDVVDVMMYLLDNPKVNGIYNVGTGHARTWNDLARALFAAVGKPANIEYIPMPDVLKDKYQYFTEADMSRLRKAGYVKPFTSLENAVVDYAGYLKTHAYM
jgi:ADP-L-glycero-D-manno-heptose 6-epimerase